MQDYAQAIRHNSKWRAHLMAAAGVLICQRWCLCVCVREGEKTRVCPSDGQHAFMSKMLSYTVYAVRALISAVP